MASMWSTVLAGSRMAPSRVPGPPPRMSIAATAGASNTIAVTPEPRRWSSACPTRTPAMSVMRLRAAIGLGVAERGEDGGEMAVGGCGVRRMGERGAMLGRQLVGRSDEKGPVLPAPHVRAVGRHHVQLVARAGVPRKGKDGV